MKLTLTKWDLPKTLREGGVANCKPAVFNQGVRWAIGVSHVVEFRNDDGTVVILKDRYAPLTQAEAVTAMELPRRGETGEPVSGPVLTAVNGGEL